MDKKKIIKKVLQFGVYGIVAVFIYFTLRDKITDIRDYEISNPVLLVLSAFIFSVNVACTSIAWAFMMRFSGEKMPFRESLNVFVSSFIVRYIPGNVWAIAARAVMNKKHGVKAIKSVWGWMIENVTFLMVGLMFSVLVLTQLKEVRQEILITVAVALPLCAAFVLRYELLVKLFDKVVKKKFAKVLGKESGDLKLSGKQKGYLIGIYIIGWIVYSLHYFVLVNAVTGVGIDQLVILTGINALSWSIGYLSIITPSGGGVREGIMILALTSLGIMGEVDAVVVTLLARLSFILGEMIYFASIKIWYHITDRHGNRK